MQMLSAASSPATLNKELRLSRSSYMSQFKQICTLRFCVISKYRMPCMTICVHASAIDMHTIEKAMHDKKIWMIGFCNKRNAAIDRLCYSQQKNAKYCKKNKYAIFTFNVRIDIYGIAYLSRICNLYNILRNMI